MLKDIVCKDGLYLLKYPNYFIGDDYEKIIILVKEILKNKPFIDIKSGLCIFDVYFNDYYGIVFEIKYNFLDSNYFDVKLIIHIDSIFLFEMDYFDIVKLDLKGNIYFYNDRYYFEPVEKINIKMIGDVFEYGELVYGEDIFNIVNKGIRLLIKQTHNFS